MKIPVYVVTGFLDAGKTTFLNRMINHDPWQPLRTLVIQFENGEEQLTYNNLGCERIEVSLKLLNSEIDIVHRKISETLSKSKFEAIWIEWNGMLAFTKLVELLNLFFSEIPFYIQNVIHVVDAKNALDLI